MATYTMELRTVCDYFTRATVESWFKDYELSNYLRPSEIESIQYANIWSKDRLAQKIVDHYFMREIGYETAALFKHKVKIKMQEMMERKLPLIYSSSIKYDMLVNVDYSETFTREASTEGESSSESESTGSGLSVNSDTPQGQISKSGILSGDYASNTGASETSSNIEDSSSSSTTSTEEYTKRIKGNSGISATAQKMVEQYRDNIIAIDEDIIKELGILFMGIY